MERRRATPVEHEAIRIVVGILIAAGQPDQGQARQLLTPLLDQPDLNDVMIPAFMFVARSLAEMAADARGDTGQAVLLELAMNLAEPPEIGDSK